MNLCSFFIKVSYFDDFSQTVWIQITIKTQLLLNANMYLLLTIKYIFVFVSLSIKILKLLFLLNVLYPL